MIPIVTELGFSSPWLLLALPIALAGLVYAYLKRGRGDRRPVATVFLLKQLRSTISARKKFIPPPKFFFELLLLFLLGVAAAGLYRKSPEERIAVLIDNSFSMSAVTPSGETRLEAAKKDLRAYLEGLAAQARITLFVTSPALNQVSDAELSIDQALSQAEAIQPVFAVDSIEGALARLVQESRYDRVIGWSDKGLASPNTRLQLRNQAQAGSGNIGFREIRVEDRGDQGSVIVADIGSYVAHDVSITAQISAFNQIAGILTEAKIGERPVLLSAGVGKVIEIPIKSSTAPAYSVRLTFPAGAVQEGINSIAGDDVAYVTSGGGTNALTVVSSAPWAATSLQRIRSFAVKGITPEQLATEPISEGIAIFHRTVPVELPAVNSLFILPPPNTALGGELIQNQAIDITRWSESNPVVNYLNVPMISLRMLVALRRPSWADEIISSTRGTAAFAGEYGGHRYVALGFDLLPYSGKKEPGLSILLLNALKWLSGATLNSGYEVAPYVFSGEKAGSEARYVTAATPDGIQDEHGIRTAPVPGLLTISTSKGKQVRAVNFFSEEESNSLALHKINVPDRAAVLDPAQHRNVSLMVKLVWLVLLLLAAELLWAIVWTLKAATSGRSRPDSLSKLQDGEAGSAAA